MLLAGLLVACDRSEETADPGEPASGQAAEPAAAAPEQPAEPPPPPPPPVCRLETMDFELGGKRRHVTFTHDEQGRLRSAEMTQAGGGRKREIAWSYDDQGRLADVGAGRLGVGYEYDDEGQLTTLKGRGAYVDRKLERDETGRVTAQIARMRGRTVGKIEYVYGEGGGDEAVATGDDEDQGPACPDQAKIYDPKGRHLETHHFTWDDHPSPLPELSAVLNPAELVLGYAVGACPRNLVEQRILFERNTSYRKQGRRWKEGEELTIRRAWSYGDDHPYPVSVRFSDDAGDDDGDEADSDTPPDMRFTYACEDA